VHQVRSARSRRGFRTCNTFVMVATKFAQCRGAVDVNRSLSVST
jgi:hypothetical protein